MMRGFAKKKTNQKRKEHEEFIPLIILNSMVIHYPNLLDDVEMLTE